MKFLFFPQSCLPFHGNTLEERPIGGIETGVIRLAAALSAAGHEVIVLTQYDNPPLTTPLYLPFKALDDVGAIDVLIGVREWTPLLLPLQAKLRLFWTGDSYDQPQSLGIGDKRVIESIDAFLSVSEWHADSFCRESGFPRSKAWPIKNGIHLNYFQGVEQRKRRRLIYSSTPYRGLRFVPALYSRLKQRYPDLELHVFSGYTVYAGSTPPPAAALREYEQIAAVLNSLPDAHLHGNLLQRQLAREFMKSSILFYPNTFVETSCITAMEAQAGGCVVLASDKGALPETVGDSGVLIPGEPGTESFSNRFCEAADNLLSDDQLWSRLSESGIKRSKQTDWNNVASRLLNFIAQHST